MGFKAARQDGGRTFGMQSLRNGDRPTWGRRADGGGLAGGAAVALAEGEDYTEGLGRFRPNWAASACL